MTRWNRLTGLVLASAALALGACGGESLPPTDEPVVVTAVDYGFEGLPEKVKAGTTLALQNESMVEVHELVAIRLPDDETRPVDELVQLPPDELASFFPGVATVVIAPPGESGFAVEGTGVLSEPGRYAVICAIPTGADPAEYLEAAAEAEGGPPEVAGGPPHLAMGMYGEVTVVE
jgi:plastocyanin